MTNLSARARQRREATRRWAAAGAVALAAGLFLAWAVAASYGPVRPRLECVMPLAAGKYVAYFGWTNTRGDVVEIPLGEDNEVTPGGAGDGRPTLFPPGSSAPFPNAAFAVTFARGDKVRWTLGPRTVIASDESVACELPERKPTPPELVVLPKRITEAKVEQPKPEPPKVEPPKTVEPPKASEPPKAEPARPRVKDPTRPKLPQPITIVEPAPLMSDALSNEPTAVGVLSGPTALGDPNAKPTTEPRGDPPPEQAGVPGGTGTGVAPPPREVVRKAARPKTRPAGRWPDDAPPRAGPVAVRLSALVGADGKVKAVRVIAGAGGAFDREARAVVEGIVFEPATEDGVAVESWVAWVVEFTPDG